MMTIDEALHQAAQLHQVGQFIHSEALLNQILAIQPTHADALHLLGVIAYQVNQVATAIQLIQKAIEHAPNVAGFHSNLAEMYRQSKDWQSSIQYGERAVALDPTSVSALSNLGLAYYDAGQYTQAETWHNRALALNPTFSCSLNNMGSIYKEYGNREQAAAFYQAAIDAAPNFADPINNLGVLFLHQQAFHQAQDCFRRAILLAPQMITAHCNLGEALFGLEHYAQALLQFEKTLQLNANHANAHYGIAKIHMHRQDFFKAENSIRQAIAIDPQSVDFYHHLAMIYHEQGHHQQALSYFNHALSLDSTLASLYLSKGSVFMELGDIAQAEEQFLQAAQDSVIETQVLAHYSLVQLRKVKPDHASLAALLRLQNLAPANQEYVYFALGKCFDDLGEWAKAFAYFAQGCELKRQRIAYSTSEQLAFTERLIHCLTPETIDYLRTFANPSAVPLFIVGMPRSGSTLVEQILSSHEQVYGAGELKYFAELIEHQPTHLHYPEHILHLSPANYHAITEQYLDYLRHISPDAPRITDKMLSNFLVIGVIHALLPNAKIIHVKRNPIDTCLSCYTKLFSEGQRYSYDLTELGQYYHCYERIMAHWRQILPQDAWLDIEYEQMVSDTESEAKRLLAFCDLHWDPACLTFYQSKRQIRTASFAQVRQPIYTTSVERWRRFEQELAPLIDALNPLSNTAYDHNRAK